MDGGKFLCHNNNGTEHNLNGGGESHAFEEKNNSDNLSGNLVTPTAIPTPGLHFNSHQGWHVRLDDVPPQDVSQSKVFSVGRTSSAPTACMRNGRWGKDEQERFSEAYARVGKDYARLAEAVGTRTQAQCVSHGQKYFIKLAKRSSGSATGDLSFCGGGGMTFNRPAQVTKVETISDETGLRKPICTISLEDVEKDEEGRPALACIHPLTHQATSRYILDSITVDSDPTATRKLRPVMEHAIGRWNNEEKEKFLEAFELYGRDFHKVSAAVGTRNVAQCFSHAQKVFGNVKKSTGKGSDKFESRHSISSSSTSSVQPLGYAEYLPKRDVAGSDIPQGHLIKNSSKETKLDRVCLLLTCNWMNAIKEDKKFAAKTAAPSTSPPPPDEEISQHTLGIRELEARIANPLRSILADMHSSLCRLPEGSSPLERSFLKQITSTIKLSSPPPAQASKFTDKVSDDESHIASSFHVDAMDDSCRTLDDDSSSVPSRRTPRRRLRAHTSGVDDAEDEESIRSEKRLRPNSEEATNNFTAAPHVPSQFDPEAMTVLAIIASAAKPIASDADVPSDTIAAAAAAAKESRMLASVKVEEEPYDYTMSSTSSHPPSPDHSTASPPTTATQILVIPASRSFGGAERNQFSRCSKCKSNPHLEMAADSRQSSLECRCGDSSASGGLASPRIEGSTEVSPVTPGPPSAPYMMPMMQAMPMMPAGAYPHGMMGGYPPYPAMDNRMMMNPSMNMTPQAMPANSLAAQTDPLNGAPNNTLFELMQAKHSMEMTIFQWRALLANSPPTEASYMSMQQFMFLQSQYQELTNEMERMGWKC